MKERMQTFLPATALIALFFLAGCNKVYDNIHNHAVVEHKFCRIEKLKVNYGLGSFNEEMKVSYDRHGNPVSILRTNEGTNLNREYRFRYDKEKRLTDYLITFIGARGVIEWHRYSYPDKHTIVDTAFYFVGEIDDPVPPNHSELGFSVWHHELDAAGRIIKSTEFDTSENNLPPRVTLYTYNEAGNLIRPPAPSFATTFYDNKINIYRTNKIWMQVHKDYSVNNHIEIGDSEENPWGHEITKYNEFGLPVKFKAYDDSGDVMGFNYHELDVEYSCKNKLAH